MAITKSGFTGPVFSKDLSLINKDWGDMYNGKKKIQCDKNCHAHCEGNHGYYPADFEFENLFEEKI
jgi:hypothetical protein